MATSVEQRGETAILGLGNRTVQHPTFSGTTSSALAQDHSSSSREHVRTQEARLNARGVARRKLRRRENARLSSNPHVVRPSPSDYTLSHPNRQTPSFPLPQHLQHLRLPSRLPQQQESSSSGVASSSAAGHFNMTYADAHFFLTHRVGVRPGHSCEEGEVGVLQAFALRAEAELRAWLQQDVFIAPDADREDGDGADGSLSPLIDLNTQDDDRDFRVMQVSRTAHNIVWQVPDNFLRLTVHCLARVLHCPTFSKDSARGRQTWILNPRPGVGRVVAPLSASMLDTPPATDIGTDVASDMASEVDSEWAVSEIGEEDSLVFVRHEEGDEDEGEGEEEDEDGVVVPYRIEEEDDSLADIEDG